VPFLIFLKYTLYGVTAIQNAIVSMCNESTSLQSRPHETTRTSTSRPSNVVLLRSEVLIILFDCCQTRKKQKPVFCSDNIDCCGLNSDLAPILTRRLGYTIPAWAERKIDVLKIACRQCNRRRHYSSAWIRARVASNVVG